MHGGWVGWGGVVFRVFGFPAGLGLYVQERLALSAALPQPLRLLVGVRESAVWAVRLDVGL